MDIDNPVRVCLHDMPGHQPQEAREHDEVGPLLLQLPENPLRMAELLPGEHRGGHSQLLRPLQHIGVRHVAVNPGDAKVFFPGKMADDVLRIGA